MRTLTPTLSQGERGLFEQAFVSLCPGKILIKLKPSPWRLIDAAGSEGLLGFDGGVVSSPTYVWVEV